MPVQLRRTGTELSWRSLVSLVIMIDVWGLVLSDN